MSWRPIIPSLRSLGLMIRSALSGSFAMLGDMALLFSLTEGLALNHMASFPVAAFFGMSVNYLISSQLVFEEHKWDNRLREYAIYVLVSSAGIVVSGLLYWGFTYWLQLYYLIAKIAATVMVFFLQFSFNKLYLFREASSEWEEAIEEIFTEEEI